jgi:hypothetical protein
MTPKFEKFLTDNYKWIGDKLYKDGEHINTDVSDEEIADAEELETVGISGEYWFDENGQTMYADGDVGDMNHEAYVIQTCISQLAGEFDVYIDEPYLETGSILEDEIVEKIIDDLDIEDESEKEDKIEQIKNDPADAMIDYLVQNTSMEIDAASDLVLNAYGSKGDAREYAIKNWNWSRVQGDSIETLKLTADALKTIAKGINNALDEEGKFYDYEDNPEVLELHEYTISTYSGKRYTITLADMEKGNVSGLEQDIAVTVSAATQQVKQMDIDAMPDFYKQKGVIGDSFQQFFQERYGGYSLSRDVYYHGTSKKNLRSILKQGLITNPKKRAWTLNTKEDSRNMFRPTLMSIENSIYVTKELNTAITSATDGDNEHDNPIIVCMELTDRMLSNDEDNMMNILDNVVSIGTLYARQRLADKVDHYLQRKTDSATYKQDIKDYFYPIFQLFQKHNIDQRHIDNFLSKMPLIYKTMLFRQASYSTELRNMLGIESSEQAEKDYIKLMEWVTKQTRFMVRKKSQYTARIEQNIGFTGKNKIVCIFTLPHYTKSDEDMFDEQVIYGKLPIDTEKKLRRLQFKSYDDKGLI